MSNFLKRNSKINIFLKSINYLKSQNYLIIIFDDSKKFTKFSKIHKIECIDISKEITEVIGSAVGATAGGTAGSIVPGAGTAAGAIAGSGAGMAAGAEMAMGEASKSGKFLGGATIESVRGDSTCVDAAAATATAERLITSDKVAAIMGADCSGVTTAVLQNVATAKGIVMISPSLNIDFK